MSFSEQTEGNPLQCPLCLSQYDAKKHEAKLLTCHHSFCLTCIHQMAQDKTAIKCPTCRKKTAIPAKGGIRGLQTNFYISQMREVMSLPKEEVGENCAKHGGQPLLFFCETCSQPICMNCTVLDHERGAGHIITDIGKVIDGFKEMLTHKATNIEGALERRKVKLQSLKTELGCLDIARDVAQEQITETFTQLKAKLDHREQKLLQKVTDLHEDRKNTIIKQAQLTKAEMKRLNQTLSHVHSLDEEGQVASVVAAAIDAKSIADLDNLCLNIDTGNPINGHIQFKYEKGLKNFVDAVKHMGEVDAQHSLPATVSFHVQPGTAGHVSSLQVKVRDGQSETMSTRDIAVMVVDPEGDTIHTTQHQPQAGPKSADSLSVQFRPQVCGEHQAIVEFLDRPLVTASKSYSVGSNNPVQVFGEPGSGPGQLNRPTSVIVSQQGNVYVADMGNKRVQIFNSSGKLVGQFKLGSNKTTTYDLALSPSTNEILCTKVAPDPGSGHMVADTVRVFDLRGDKKYQFALSGATNALFLAVTKQGLLVVTDSASHSVSIYSREGASVVTFGSYGSEPGLFNFPSAVCVANNEEIVVSDTRNHRVQVFDKRGNYTHHFGCEGKGKGQFRSPRGIAADDHGHVLVADSCNRIQVFRIDGSYVSSIDSEADPINEPYNMDVTPDGHVYLADFKSCRVKKYKYM